MKFFKILAVILAYFLLNAIFADGIAQSRKAEIVFVYDGDTVLSGKREKIRLLGIDTPEMNYDSDKLPQCFAFEAKKYVEDRVKGKWVMLTFESGKKDKYGRTLAWVWYGKDFKKLLNAEIIRDGYGRVFRRYYYSKTRMLKKLEKKARKAGLGMWAPGACKG